MLAKQEEAAGWDELFAVVENRLRGDSQRLSPPTAVLRLKAAVAGPVSSRPFTGSGGTAVGCDGSSF
jgi:hypothetical protein